MDTSPKYILAESGRRTYAFGLPWFSADSDEPIKKQALALIKSLNRNHDLIAERSGNYPQYSIASTEDGMRSGAISAASIIADTVFEESWLYVIEIEDSIWITFGRDGNIMPDGDRIYADVDEAKKAFLDLEPETWKTLAIPASWKELFYKENPDAEQARSDIEESSLKDVFQKPSKATAKMVPVSSTTTIAKTGAILAVVAVMGYFGWQFVFPTQTGPSQEEIQREAEALAEQARIQQENLYAQLDANKPWQVAPFAPALIDSCLDDIIKMPLRPAGYQVAQVECANGVITGTYGRMSSYPSWLREWAEKSDQFQINIDTETSDAFITLIGEDLPERGPEELVDYTTMVSFIKETDLLIEGDATYTQPIEQRYAEYPEYVPLYGRSDLSIITSNPQQWATAFERLAGVSITSVLFDTTTNSYTLEGEIYVGNQ